MAELPAYLVLLALACASGASRAPRPPGRSVVRPIGILFGARRAPESGRMTAEIGTVAAPRCLLCGEAGKPRPRPARPAFRRARDLGARAMPQPACGLPLARSGAAAETCTRRTKATTRTPRRARAPAGRLFDAAKRATSRTTSAMRTAVVAAGQDAGPPALAHPGRAAELDNAPRRATLALNSAKPPRGRPTRASDNRLSKVPMARRNRARAQACEQTAA